MVTICIAYIKITVREKKSSLHSFSVSIKLYIMLNIMYNNKMWKYLWVQIMPNVLLPL